jgi:hypothetical protein
MAVKMPLTKKIKNRRGRPILEIKGVEGGNDGFERPRSLASLSTLLLPWRLYSYYNPCRHLFDWLVGKSCYSSSLLLFIIIIMMGG